jgi:hypothetical protein
LPTKCAERRSALIGTADRPPANPGHSIAAKGLSYFAGSGQFTQQQQAFGPEGEGTGHESDTDVCQVCSLPAK